MKVRVRIRRQVQDEKLFLGSCNMYLRNPQQFYVAKHGNQGAVFHHAKWNTHPSRENRPDSHMYSVS